MRKLKKFFLITSLCSTLAVGIIYADWQYANGVENNISNELLAIIDDWYYGSY